MIIELFCSDMDLFSKGSSLKAVQVDPDKFHLDDKELIGRGTFSTVYKSQLLGMDVAVKVFSSVKDITDKKV